jgi:hypothetical protein
MVSGSALVTVTDFSQPPVAAFVSTKGEQIIDPSRKRIVVTIPSAML